MGLALIIAIGGQNVFVLRQGLRREHVGAVVAVCAVSDMVLIVFGVVGLGRLLDSAPWLTDAARWGGAAFLCGYALLAARRAWRPADGGLDAEASGGAVTPPGSVVARSRVGPVVWTAVALTWLNPHVYLDTVFLLGTVAATYETDRGWFALGAVTASLVWFTALGYGARYLGRWLRTPRAWRLLDGTIAVIMLAMAVKLVA